MSPDLLEALRNSTPIDDDPKLDTLAKFTIAVINTKGRVGDEALADFFEAGYTQENALDVILGVSLASLCNYANNMADTPINPELQQYAKQLDFKIRKNFYTRQLIIDQTMTLEMKRTFIKMDRKMKTLFSRSIR